MTQLCGIPNVVGYSFLYFFKKYSRANPRNMYKIIRLHADILKILKESEIPENQ
jgi:hypothetical protein